MNALATANDNEFDHDIDCQCDPTSHLITLTYCFTCCTDEDQNNKVSIQRCSRCQCAYYCSRECQLEGYDSHKEFCLEYKKLNKKLAKEKKALLETDDPLAPGKYFSEETIGHFWGLLDPRAYCRVRYGFAEHILEQAHYMDLKQIYDRGLSHFMELLRLIHSDNMGIRYKVPFILITLNRDEDAYNFIKWWLTIDPNGTYDWGDVPKNTKQGDWLYLTNESIFENFGDYISRYTALSFVASLVLIKIRLVIKLKRSLMMKDKINLYLSQCDELFCNKEHSNMIGDIIVGNYVCTYPSHLKLSNVENMKKVINEQELHVNTLLSEMVQMNKMFVQSLVNPRPMRQQNYPQYSSQGSPEEAFIVMNDCCRLFARTPGAIKRLQGLVGKMPDYDPTFTSMF